MTLAAPGGRVAGSELVVGPRLAVGGMAEIFEARFLGADAVLKRALPSAEPRRLESEATALEALDSPHVVRLLGRHDGALVLERVRGPTLGALLEAAARRGQLLPLPALAALADGLLSGLDAVHSARSPTGESLGLLHRDLSPGNVLLDGTGRVVLCDLGLGRATALDPTTVAGVKGTLAYMSFEQLRAEEAGPESDVFGAALLLYEAATLVPARPRKDTGIAELLEARSQLPAPPSAFRSELSGAFDAALRHALDPIRQARTRSAAAFREQLLAALPTLDANALGMFIRGLTVEVHTPAPTVDVAVAAPIAAEPPRPPEGSRSSKVALWATAGVLLGVLSVWALSSPTPSPPPPVPALELETFVVSPARDLDEETARVRRHPSPTPLEVVLASEREGETPVRSTPRALDQRRPRVSSPPVPPSVAPVALTRVRFEANGAPLHVTGATGRGLAPYAQDIEAAETFSLVGAGGAKAVVRVLPGSPARIRIGAGGDGFWDVACNGRLLGRATRSAPVSTTAGARLACRLSREGESLSFTLGLTQP